MAFAFLAATPPTRVSRITANGADVVSYLAAVVTVMPLYDLAHPSRSPFPHLRDVFAAARRAGHPLSLRVGHARLWRSDADP